MFSFTFFCVNFYILTFLFLYILLLFSFFIRASLAGLNPRDYFYYRMNVFTHLKVFLRQQHVIRILILCLLFVEVIFPCWFSIASSRCFHPLLTCYFLHFILFLKRWFTESSGRREYFWLKKAFLFLPCSLHLVYRSHRMQFRENREDRGGGGRVILFFLFPLCAILGTHTQSLVVSVLLELDA